MRNERQEPKTEKPAAGPAIPGRLWTYQDLAAHFGVSDRTIRRWFNGREKFHPTPNTVRITQSQLDAFIQDSNKKPVAKK